MFAFAVTLSGCLLTAAAFAADPPDRRAAPETAQRAEALLWQSDNGDGDAAGQVPEELLQRIRDDLRRRLAAAADEESRAPAEQIRLVRAEAMTWSNGALGCPQRGAMYTDALVEGFRVILQAGGRDYDYRATRRGHFMLCERPALPGRPPVAGDEPPTE